MVFTLTKKDKEVIKAFLSAREMESKKLTSTGTQLDGSWIGGSNIASRRSDGSIYLRPISSKAEQTIHNYFKKEFNIVNNLTERNKIYAILIKHGNNHETSLKLINDNYSYVSRVYPDESIAKKAEILRAL